MAACQACGGCLLLILSVILGSCHRDPVTSTPALAEASWDCPSSWQPVAQPGNTVFIVPGLCSLSGAEGALAVSLSGVAGRAGFHLLVWERCRLTWGVKGQCSCFRKRNVCEGQPCCRRPAGCLGMVPMGVRVTPSSVAVLFLWPERKLLHCPGPDLSSLMNTSKADCLWKRGFLH